MTASSLLGAREPARPTSGSSQAPGTRTTVTFWACAPWRTSASTAPSTRRSTMKWLKRLATMREPRALGATTSFLRSRASSSASLPCSAPSAHRVRAARARPPRARSRGCPRSYAGCSSSRRISCSPRSTSTCAPRPNSRSGASADGRRDAPRRSARASASSSRAHVASRRDVDEGAAPGLFDLRRWPRAGAGRRRAASRRRGRATVEPVCTRQSGGVAAVEVALDEREELPARRWSSRRRSPATRCPSGRGAIVRLRGAPHAGAR